MVPGRKTSLTIHLTAEQRQTLLAWQRSTTVPAGLARRSRMILLAADGMPIAHIATTVGSVVAMSISGWGDFCALVWRGWQIKGGRKTRDGVYALEYNGGGGLGKAMDVGTTLHRDQHGWFF